MLATTGAANADPASTLIQLLLGLASLLPVGVCVFVWSYARGLRRRREREARRRFIYAREQARREEEERQ